jgi:hypothetical protein
LPKKAKTLRQQGTRHLRVDNAVDAAHYLGAIFLTGVAESEGATALAICITNKPVVGVAAIIF